MFSLPTLVLALATLAPTGQDLHAPTHGRLDWFHGSFDELLAEADRADRIVFIDFWADWCGWCKRLDQDVFSETTVVGEMKSLLCYAVDKDSETGGPVAARYGVESLPTLVFLRDDGEVLDVITGYLPADRFLARVRRIKRGEGTLPALRAEVAKNPDDLFKRFELAIKLTEVRSPDAGREVAHVRQQVQRGEGFDPESLDDHWRLVQAFERLGDRPSSTRHMKRVEELDPERRSYPLRRRRLNTLQRQIQQAYARDGALDTTPLRRFIAEETHDALKFDGWRLAVFLHGFVAEEARKRGQPTLQAEHEAEVRKAEAQAWRVCPPDQVASFGHDLAWSWYTRAGDLTEEELAFAVKVAETAAAAAPDSANHLDTLACCLYVAGAQDRALELLKRAVELDPDELRYRRRLIEFREGGK